MIPKRQHNEGANGNANEGSRGDDNINDYANDDDENLEIYIIWLLRFSFFSLPSVFLRFLPVP